MKRDTEAKVRENAIKAEVILHKLKSAHVLLREAQKEAKAWMSCLPEGYPEADQELREAIKMALNYTRVGINNLEE